MRGNILSVYSFRIKTKGYGVEQLYEELKKNRITESEFNYLREFCERNTKGLVS